MNALKSRMPRPGDLVDIGVPPARDETTGRFAEGPREKRIGTLLRITTVMPPIALAFFPIALVQVGSEIVVVKPDQVRVYRP
jgi:hypothetical protein